MRAIDTNVLLRLVTADDPEQEAIARDLIAGERVLVPLTVVLECEWVLRSYFKRRPGEIAAVLDQFTDVEGLVFEQVAAVRWALGRLSEKADFADLVHVVAAAASDASALVTFDAGMEAEAGPGTPIPVHVLR